jgi:CHAD domain-containing protein
VSRAGGEVFRVRRGEPVAALIVRVGCEGGDAIRSHLGRGAPDSEAVHEIRKLTKRLRAVGRLFRDEVGGRRVRRVGRAFRDVARALSASRDAAVRVQALDGLAERFAGVVRERAAETIRRAARAELAEATRRHDARSVRRLAAAVVRARDEMARWRPRHDGWAAIGPGLARLYRRGRSGWRTADAEPTVANLHEWRKRVKDLRYAAELLEPIWPDVVGPFAKAVDRLADGLGDDHDLAVLIEWLRARDEDEAPALVALAETARRRLLREAGALGARIYGEPTDALCRRWETWWDVWSSGPDDGGRALRPVIRLVPARRTGT